MADDNDTTPDETVETPAEEVVEATPDAPENAADAGPADADAGGDGTPVSDAEAVEEAQEVGPTLTRKEQRAAARHVEASKRPARSTEERIADRIAERARKAAARRRRREKAKTARAGAERGPAKTQSTADHGPGRPKVRQGLVVSDKADKTITVRVDSARRHRRYEKIVRSSSTLHAHDEANDANIGDTVRIIESRPLSRTKRWRLVEVLERAK